MLFLARKSVSQLIGEGKVDACYLGPQKCSSQLFGAMKKRMTAISCQKNWFTAIWSPKKMDPSYLVVENTG